MTTYAVTGLRRMFPDGHIVWAIQDTCRPVVATPRLASEVVEIDRAAWRKKRLAPGVVAASLRGMLALRKHKFDVGFDFQGHSKTALCLRLSGARNRFSAPGTDAFARRLNPMVELPPSAHHRVEMAVALVRQWQDIELPDLPMMPPAESRLGKGFVSIQTGAGGKGKTYPIPAWKIVAEALVLAGHRVIYVGGPNDPHPTGPGEDWVGKLSLAETMSVVASSSLHLAGDTGTGHVAAAYGVPVVSLFGPAMPSSAYRPYHPSAVVLERPSSPSDIPPGEVIAAAKTILGVGK